MSSWGTNRLTQHQETHPTLNEKIGDGLIFLILLLLIFPIQCGVWNLALRLCMDILTFSKRQLKAINLTRIQKLIND